MQKSSAKDNFSVPAYVRIPVQVRVYAYTYMYTRDCAFVRVRATSDE
jgi:hypothetical protein